MYISEINENLLKQAEINNLQAMKLLQMKTTMMEYEIKLRIYPATEIHKKRKTLVNVLLFWLYINH